MSISRNLSFLAEGVSSTGVLGATYGGTGQSSITTGDLLYGSASNTISKLAIGSTGTILRVVGGVPTWGTDYTGTVTSVAASVPSFLSISGSPITTSGTLAITYSGTALPIANGGTAQTSFTSGQILYGSFNQSSNLTFDGNNVGIGITPSSFSSSWKVLQIGYGAFAQSSAGNDAPQILANTYYNGSNYIYQLSDTACRFQTNNPGFTWYVAPSGTAGNPITFTAAMNISGSGGVSIGNTTDPGAGNLSVSGSVISPYINAGSGNLFLQAGNATKAIVTSSGHFLLGNTTDNPGGGLISVKFDGSATNGINLQTTYSSTGSDYILFYNSAGSLAGYISQNGTTTVNYVTSSDYRLKENIAPITNALERVAQLKPVTYTWKNTVGEQGEGFIAHELAEVCPLAVSGEKDAIDAEGNIKAQGIDTSKLVALLTSAIQEQQVIIEQLKQKVGL